MDPPAIPAGFYVSMSSRAKDNRKLLDGEMLSPKFFELQKVLTGTG